MSTESKPATGPRWVVIIATVCGIVGLAFAIFVGWIVVTMIPLAKSTYQEQGASPRPTESGERAAFYRELDGQGAVGATYAAVFLEMGVDSIPGNAGALLWRGKRMTIAGLNWRDNEHLEVLVRGDSGYERYKSTIRTKSRPGLEVTTVVAPDTGAYR